MESRKNLAAEKKRCGRVPGRATEYNQTITGKDHITLEMNIEDYREFCLSLGGDVEEKLPFTAFQYASGVLVFYVHGHMFSFPYHEQGKI